MKQCCLLYSQEGSHFKNVFQKVTRVVAFVNYAKMNIFVHYLNCTISIQIIILYNYLVFHFFVIKPIQFVQPLPRGLSAHMCKINCFLCTCLCSCCVYICKTQVLYVNFKCCNKKGTKVTFIFFNVWDILFLNV